MTTSDDAGAASQATEHCRRCGRVVAGTLHSRTSYAVAGFVLHTGDTEEAVVRRSDSDELALVYQRLVRPVRLVTCAACYADPVERRRHETWRYPVD